MGRYVNGAATAAAGNPNGPYIAGRLYGLPGLAGPSQRATGLVTQPVQIRPGLWSLTGLWCLAMAAGAFRLGLYADAGGRPGALIKDAGSVNAAGRGLLKATFEPVVIDALDGLAAHLVVVTAAGVEMGHLQLADYGADDADWTERFGLDQAASLSFNESTGRPTVPRALQLAGVSPAAPLANTPNLTGAVGAGAIYGGMIFG